MVIFPAMAVLMCNRTLLILKNDFYQNLTQLQNLTNGSKSINFLRDVACPIYETGVESRGHGMLMFYFKLDPTVHYSFNIIGNHLYRRTYNFVPRLLIESSLYHGKKSFLNPCQNCDIHLSGEPAQAIQFCVSLQLR